MFGALNISTSGLVAQRTRMEVITANLINRDSQLDAQGNYAPYRRRVPVFAVGDPATGGDRGVHVQEIALDTSPLRKVHEPGNPLADAQGYVEYPNVDLATEMINAIDASRAYEANITAAEATKSMMLSSLRLLA
ncbi:MAG: flagellar basal body rod protein FlgC [Phycisphaeraceae bacterium]|nr:flagellar basal body rod protein FlgC [Phycisphaeraceae bacterium]